MMFKKQRLLDKDGRTMHLVAFESLDSSLILLAFSPEVLERAGASPDGGWRRGLTAVNEGLRSAGEVADLISAIESLGYKFMLQAPGLEEAMVTDPGAIEKYLRSL